MKPRKPGTKRGLFSSKKNKKQGPGPAIPDWHEQLMQDSKAMPMFRSPKYKTSGALLGRVLRLKPNELALVAAGLAVLIMAPLAEHMVSSPESEEGTLQQGFDVKGGSLNAGNPFEDGVAGIAPGGLLGQDSEIITPLNARHPSDLIVGGGLYGNDKAAKTKPKRRRRKRSSGWKDAISEAKNAARRSTRKAASSVQRGWKPSKQLAGKLNGLSSLSHSSGRTGSGLKLDAPRRFNQSARPEAEHHLSRVDAKGSGFRSLASATGGGGSGNIPGGAFFDQRVISQGGTSVSGAAEALPGGVSGAGQGTGRGGATEDQVGKVTPNTSTQDNENITNSREDLAFLRKKMNMEKAIDLKWAKKRYNELERKKMIEQTMLQTAQQAFLKVLDKVMGGGGGQKGGGQQSSGGGKSSSGGSSPGQGSQVKSPHDSRTNTMTGDRNVTTQQFRQGTQPKYPAGIKPKDMSVEQSLKNAEKVTNPTPKTPTESVETVGQNGNNNVPEVNGSKAALDPQVRKYDQAFQDHTQAVKDYQAARTTFDNSAKTDADIKALKAAETKVNATQSKLTEKYDGLPDQSKQLDTTKESAQTGADMTKSVGTDSKDAKKKKAEADAYRKQLKRYAEAKKLHENDPENNPDPGAEPTAPKSVNDKSKAEIRQDAGLAKQ